MKIKKQYLILIASLFLCFGQAQHTNDGNHSHGNNSHDSNNHSESNSSFEEREVQVMPFDLDKTMHIFSDTAFGGVQQVIAVNSNDFQEIQLIQEHLLEQSQRFSVGDFGDPSYLHGDAMPGLAGLIEAAKEGLLTVRYEALPNGATISYSSENPQTIIDIHLWFQAQVSDHGSHATSQFMSDTGIELQSDRSEHNTNNGHHESSNDHHASDDHHNDDGHHETSSNHHDDDDHHNDEGHHDTSEDHHADDDHHSDASDNHHDENSNDHHMNDDHHSDDSDHHSGEWLLTDYVADVQFALRSEIIDAETMAYVGLSETILDIRNPDLSVQESNIVEITLSNTTVDEHDMVIEFMDKKIHSEHVVFEEDVTTFAFEADKAGHYNYYCTVEGHREAGMEGVFHVDGKVRKIGN